jgi:glutamate-5-semialdehyde dehydrogenase
MAEVTELRELRAGMPLVFGGDRIVAVPAEVAERFRPGDAVVIVEATADVLRIPAAERAVAGDTVARAVAAFAGMGGVTDAQISRFFTLFADRLASDDTWAEIARANAEDVATARARGRSTTRLVADEKLRRGMIEGLRGWSAAPSRRGRVIETVEHPGWKVDLVGAELGVVGFVFEGRPNVLADATGVLRGGNTVVFRIGRDALGTARQVMRHGLEPALAEAGLPAGTVGLVDSPEHAAGWALFGDRRLALAVARGSGPAVALLGALARQAGIPASLHGTGGAWLVASRHADRARFAAATRNSLDRKVCNTMNVCCIVRDRAAELVPVLLESLVRAGEERGQSFKLHVAASSEALACEAAVPAELFRSEVTVRRAEGDVRERQAELLDESELGREWEWEETPELTLKIVDDLEHAIALFNRQSPQFIASLISEDAAEHERFYATVNAPFVGDGFTRWVDGQYALCRPELGLSNWQGGRLFGRGGVLSGDSVFTVRGRVTQTDPAVRR